jgi:ParB-like chromosome segregation protein Spo0J
MPTNQKEESATLRAFEEMRAHIEYVSIDTLRSNPRNARTHSRRQIRRIAESIRRFGFINPIIVADAGVVLAGHGRLEAARLLVMSVVPVLRFTHLTAAEKKAYVIADNRIAEQAGWDRELLALELGELADLLPAENLDVSLTGFDVAEIDLLLADMHAAADNPDDAVPGAPQRPTTRPGESWALGKHRLHCGDARDDAAYLRLMEGAKASAAFADPPYNLRVKDIGGRGRIRHPEFAFASGEMTSATA